MPPNNRQTDPRAWTTHEVELDRIRDNPSPVRPIDTDAVASLKESLGVIGQQAPIVLTADYVLVSGRQRVAAQRARGESTIKAVFIDLPEVLTRIATLDENLCRLELTAFQRAELLAERKALHEQLHPGSRHGAGPKGEGSALGFTRTMAELTGRGRSTIAEDCLIGQMPESVRSLIRGTPLEHQKTALLKLARVSGEDQQRRACQALLGGSGTGAPEPVNTAGTAIGQEEERFADEGEEEDALEEAITVSASTLVESALDAVEGWLAEAVDSPQAENRYAAVAIALTNSAARLLERAASGIEATHPRSPYAKRVRSTARALSRRVERMSNELKLVTECDCGAGCSACGFVGGLAVVDLEDPAPQDPG